MSLTELAPTYEIFKLKDGTEMQVGEFDIRAEIWVQKSFESSGDFMNQILGVGKYKEPQLMSVLRTVVYLLTEESKEELAAKRTKNKNGSYKSLVATLVDNVDKKEYQNMAKCLFNQIKASIPPEMLAAAKKKKQEQP